LALSKLSFLFSATYSTYHLPNYHQPRSFNALSQLNTCIFPFHFALLISSSSFSSEVKKYGNSRFFQSNFKDSLCNGCFWAFRFFHCAQALTERLQCPCCCPKPRFVWVLFFCLNSYSLVIFSYYESYLAWYS